MKENGLLVGRKIYKAKRRSKRSKPRAERPLQFWGIDMTKFIIEGLGWAYLVIVLDWFTKEIVGIENHKYIIDICVLQVPYLILVII